jgi:hypothetical protein
VCQVYVHAAAIRVIIQHRQEYQHRYSREDEPDSLVNVVGESRIRITIVEDVAAGIDIARTNILVTTNKIHSRLIRQSKIWKTIPKEIWSSNTTIDVEKELTSSNKMVE